MKKACLYIRVSTDEQADKGFSQRDQAERLQIHCLKNDIEVTKVIFEDYSAKTFNRPEWVKLLSEMKRSRGKAFDYVMFTKWDRFSRNTADAYQMIRLLTNDYQVEPVAIEQPLDLAVPESKTILAVYLSMPEVENDRRALNVKYGMRRAKKEGRWMGLAPIGYKNRITEDGRKYIAIHEPEATYMKQAFEMLAEGTFATEHVWMKVKEMGLKCSRSSFWDYIRNPGYCGKIRIPAFKDENAQLVDGLHEPLISESLFYKVQDVLNGRKRILKQKQGAKAVTPRSLVLRGFLLCEKCGDILTGSASRGRSHYYHYYHCKAGCPRYRADRTNELFERELKNFVPRKGMAELFKSVVCDSYFENRRSKADRTRTIQLINEQNNRLTKSMELLLDDVITGAQYQSIKKECENAIARAEAELKKISEEDSDALDIEELASLAVSNLKKLPEFYLNADSDIKRSIIGSIFTEKWIFDGEIHRTGKMNKAAQLIYHINNKLRHKKTGIKFLEKFHSGEVHW